MYILVIIKFKNTDLYYAIFFKGQNFNLKIINNNFF